MGKYITDTVIRLWA